MPQTPVLSNTLDEQFPLFRFPLFEGMSRSELMQVAGNTKFGFVKLPPDKPVVSEGDQCRQLFFLVKGTLQVTSGSDDHSYRLREAIGAPWLFQPEALFGSSPRFTCSVRTLSPSQFITLSKDDFLQMTDDFLVVRLNFLNLLSTLAQRRGRHAWRHTSDDLRRRIVAFLLVRCCYPAGRKELYVTMNTLARELNDSRLNVSRALNAMQQQGILELHRSRIVVPSVENLLADIK